jgi:hypothetical protein
MAYRTRPTPKTPRRAVLAGSPRISPQAEPAVVETEQDEKPKKRATRKRAEKAETDE